jgi:uncharacterized membrane protein
MKTFSIKEALSAGWEIVKKRFWFVVGTTLVYTLFNSSFKMRGVDEYGPFSWPFFLAIIPIGIIFWVISTVVQIGYAKIYLKLHHHHQAAFKELFTHWDLFWKYLGAMILYGFRVLLGFILLIVPGIVWAIKFQFIPLLVVDKGLGPVEAMRESGKMTEGHKWHLLKFGLVLMAVNLLGFLCFFIGLLVTIPLTVLAHIHIYRKLSHSHQGA